MNALEFVMGLNARPFADGAAHVKREIAEIKDSAVRVGELSHLGDALGVLGVSFAAFKSVEGVSDTFKEIFEQGKQLRAEATATGESITNLITIQKAYQDVGMDPGSAVTNMAMLQNALGGVNAEGEPTKKIFEDLGLSMDRMKSEDYPTQLREIGVAISGLATQSDKMAAVRAIFGRQGANMINILSDTNAINEAAKVTDEKAAVYEKNAALFTKVTNDFEMVSAKTKGFFLGAAESAANQLSPVLEEVKSIDTIKIGEKVGTGLGNAIGNFRADWIAASSDSAQLTGQLVALAFSPTSLKPLGLELLNIASSFGDGIRKAVEGAKATGDNKGYSGISDNMATAGIQSWIESFMERVGETQRHLVHVNPDGSERPATDKEFRDSGAASVFGDLREFHQSSNQDILKQIQGVSIDEKGTAARKELEDPTKQAFEELANRIKQITSSAPIFHSSQTSAAAADDASTPGKKKFSLSDIHGDSGSSKEGKHEESDRLAKIGLFVGGAGPANDHARRTADATVALHALLKQAISSGIKILAPMPNNGSEAIA
jgi:hypothetical protein